MDWKQIILALSILIIAIVFYQQFQAGCGARRNKEGMEAQSKTDFTESAKKTKLDNFCNNSYADPKDLPLREYYIKSSYNSAYDGNDVSCSTIINRLVEGYRFLDFNVFSSEQEVYVGFSKNNTPEPTSHGNLKLSDALECIARNAFVKPTSPPAGAVSWDYTELPLFVNIRVFRGPKSTLDIVSSVANVINPNSGASGASAVNVSQPSASSHYYVSGKNTPIKVDSCTTLSSISKKIIFTMNIENILEVYTPSAEFASNIPAPTIAAVNSFVNFLTGGNTCPAFYRYNDASLTSRTNTLMRASDDLKSYQTNIRYMIIVYPHPTDEQPQPNITLFALNCSALILPMRVYLGDDSGNLALNTYIFDYNQSAFVPAAKLQLSIKNYQTGGKG
jgi:hypothetical protein